VISKQKLSLIHVGKKELGLSDPEYREILRHHAGVESAADLDEARGFYEQRLKIPALGPQTRAQANTVIEALKRRVQSELKKAIASRPAAPDSGPIGPSQQPPETPSAF
jgi:hypothetical protein